MRLKSRAKIKRIREKRKRRKVVDTFPNDKGIKMVYYHKGEDKLSTEEIVRWAVFQDQEKGFVSIWPIIRNQDWLEVVREPYNTVYNFVGYATQEELDRKREELKERGREKVSRGNEQKVKMPEKLKGKKSKEGREGIDKAAITAGYYDFESESLEVRR